MLSSSSPKGGDLRRHSHFRSNGAHPISPKEGAVIPVPVPSLVRVIAESPDLEAAGVNITTRATPSMHVVRKDIVEIKYRISSSVAPG